MCISTYFERSDMMESMSPKYVKKQGIFLYGCKVPHGAVYMYMEAKDGYSETYVWVTDVLVARHNQNGFPVYILKADDARSHRMYVDAKKGFARVLKKYIDELDEKLIMNCKPMMCRGDFIGLEPKEPTGGQHYKPSKGYKHYLTGLYNGK